MRTVYVTDFLESGIHTSGRVGLTRGTCFVVDYFELVVVASSSPCFCGSGAFWVGRDFVFGCVKNCSCECTRSIHGMCQAAWPRVPLYYYLYYLPAACNVAFGSIHTCTQHIHTRSLRLTPPAQFSGVQDLGSGCGLASD